MNWLRESNRYLHMFLGALVAIVFTIFGSLIAAVTCEVKDKAKGGKFDWLDIAATMLGGLVGQAIQILLIYIAYVDGISMVILGISTNVIFLYCIVSLLSGNWKWPIDSFNKIIK